MLSEDRYYSGETMTLLPIRRLTTRPDNMETTSAEFHGRRTAATS